MVVRPLVPDLGSLACDGYRLEASGVTVFVSSSAAASSCPQCHQASCRVHSHYERTLADLPWQGLPLRLRWRSRRFFCDNPACPQRVFTERCPKVTRAYGRRTCRLTEALEAMGFVSGGEAGARLAQRLAMPCSPDTLLRLIRRSDSPIPCTPRVLGVDDWAFRRGQTYGTILCDLERHRPVELLPERSSVSLASWLRAHPGVEIVSRDRADFYIKGAADGAPSALQVTDRWHLLKNLREALGRMAERLAPEIRAATKAAAVDTSTSSVERGEGAIALSTPSISPRSTRDKELRERRRMKRLDRDAEIRKLRSQGLSGREIAHRLGIHRSTVRQVLRAGDFRERAERRYFRRTDAFEEHLRQRWGEGCHNARRLFADLQQQGFRGSYYMVRRTVARWRRESKSVADGIKARRSPIRCPSPTGVAWLLIKPRSELTDEEGRWVQALQEHCVPLTSAAALAQQFRDLVRRRDVAGLDDWLNKARDGPDLPEMRRFADGLGQDLSAVRAALSLSWSNGQTEGQVNRLKTIKRQMFGRARFDLLRRRVLWAG
jgi:transposase